MFKYFLFICFPLLLLAQEPMYVHLSDEQGIPERSIYQIEEDDNGLLWLATTSGLYSYNGDAFKHYINERQTNSSVFGLEFDKKGRLWFTSMRSQLFYIENDEMVLFADLSEEFGKKILDFNIVNNDLIIDAKINFYSINIDTKIKRKILSRSFNSAHSMLYRFKEKDYLFSNSNLYVLEKDSLVLYATLLPKVTSPHKRRFFKTNDNLYFRLQKDNKVFFYKIEASKFIETNAFKEITGLEINHSKRVCDSYWFLTPNGAYKYSLVNGFFVLENHYLAGMNVSDVILDRNKNYIFSTLDNGLFFIPDTSVKFLKDKSFNKSVITELEVINDSIINYISDHNRLNSVDFFNRTQASRKIDRFQNQLIYSDTLKNKTFFINNSELEIYNPINLNVIKRSRTQYLKKLKRLNEETYIGVRHNGIQLLNNDLFPKKIIKEYAWDIAINSSQDFYVRTQNGLAYITLKNDTLKAIKHNEKGILTLAITNKTNTNRTWAARHNWGLYLIEKDKIIKAYYKDDGLLDNTIIAMDSDEKNLWMASSKGIQKLNYVTDEFTSFGVRDGIVKAPILSIELSENYVWYQTSNGIYQFPKTKKKKTISIPNLYFSNVKIGDKSKEIKTDYALNYNVNKFEVEFMINGFMSLDQYQFEYKVEGLENTWKKLNFGKHDLSFTSLPSGVFTISVRAIDIFENTYTATKKINIKVNLPFWKTWWFYTIGVLIAGALIVAYYKNKIRKKEVERLKEITKLSLDNELITLKLENLRSQMNPHFIFNALNSIQDYIVSKDTKYATKYLANFSRLIRLYLNHSQFEEITLSKEIEALNLYLGLEKDRFEKTLSYVVNIDDALDTINTFVPPLFIQPYVENAIEHGLLHKKENQKLEVNFKLNQEKNSLVCEIIDNGIGRVSSREINKKNEFKPFATQANTTRVQLMNKKNKFEFTVDILDLYEDGNPIGTSVVINMPLIK